jgi:hypothetical protein
MMDQYFARFLTEKNSYTRTNPKNVWENTLSLQYILKNIV